MDKWFEEIEIDGEKHQYLINKTIVSGRTKFQKYDIIDSVSYGKMLFLDNCSQSCEKDEYIYHENLIHPPMLIHDNPEKILLIGAGGGGAAREILKHNDVMKLDIVDLDEELNKICIQHLEKMHQNSFSNPKIRMLFQDGFDYVKNCKEKYDVVIIDLVDLLNSTATLLYQKDFYAKIKENCMKENGILLVQSMYITSKEYLNIYKSIKNIFRNADIYKCYIPSFWSMYCFTIASDFYDFKDTDFIDTKILEKNIQIVSFDALSFSAGRIFTKEEREEIKKIA